MEKRSQSDPDLASTNRRDSKNPRVQKINRSLRQRGETNFQLTDTAIFDCQKYLKNAKLEVLDDKNEYEIPPPYTSLSNGITKFKSETDLKSIDKTEISLENLKSQHKRKKNRFNHVIKQDQYSSFFERLFGSILSISCVFPKKIAQNNQQKISYSDLEMREFVGAGAQGSVYRAIYRNKEVAVKVVKSKEDADIQHLMKLDHRNLVKFKGVSVDCRRNIFAIVMEYCPKKSLYEFLDKQFLLKPSRIIDMAKQIAEGMNYLHEKKIVHRDLKSPNILLDENDILKITDFGACKEITGQETNIKDDKSFKTTVYWMAPELIRNENYSEKVDIYSFGVVFWELWTCERPYDKLDRNSVMFCVGKNKISLQIPNFVPDGIKILLIQCFGKAKNRPSFKNVIKHLDIFCQNEDLLELDQEFEQNKSAWKEDIRRTCRNFLTDIDPYELNNQVEMDKKELERLRMEKSEIIAEIENKIVDNLNLFYRLQNITLELDQREEMIIYKEKKLNIRPRKRLIKPLMKQIFKNELSKIPIFHKLIKSKNLWLERCLDTQILKNIDYFYYMNKSQRFKVTRNYGLNFYSCVPVKSFTKYNLDSKIILSILNEKNLCEYNRLHFLDFNSRKLNKLNKNLPFYMKNKLKERIKWIQFSHREKDLKELHVLKR